MIKVKRRLHFVRRNRGRRVVSAAAPPPVSPGRIPRISRLMALAIHCDCLIRESKVTDLSALARLAHVTQPRMTQIMNLNHLAPDIQEAVLHLPPVAEGRDPITERDLRPIARLMDWQQQRAMWRALRNSR